MGWFGADPFDCIRVQRTVCCLLFRSNTPPFLSLSYEEWMEGEKVKGERNRMFLRNQEDLK